ncbi:MAG: CubicO group peptidase (beta-lactamase class C family) [Verrucomicrobiales bacterium]|jgi:CubicO group peptidase (beta-lactamase class C family)
MVKNQLPKSALPIGIGDVRDGVGFGLGFSVRMETSDKEPAGRVGEYGWGGAASTHFWISPKDHLIVITLRQFMPYQWTLETDLKPLIYDGLIE